MRLCAGLCGLLLATLTGCETLPEIVKIEIDERIIEVKRKPVPPREPVSPADPAPGAAAPVQPDAQPQR